jgi:hypothetical protein
VEPIHYQDARVYQRAVPYVPQVGDSEDASIFSQADIDAITGCLWVTKDRAQERLDNDVKTLLGVDQPWVKAQVIVTYGCPDEMAAATRKKSPFHATVKLGDAKTYARFADIGATYWFCGAPTDKLTYQMYKSPTKLCSNCFRPGPRKLPSLEPYILKTTDKAGPQ